ncbi:MAG: hypothetical protein ACLUFL_12235 [Flavonifractor plautii]
MPSHAVGPSPSFAQMLGLCLAAAIVERVFSCRLGYLIMTRW